jgi:hypothetical protein
MGSYRVIVIGPPDPVQDLVQEVCDYISQKDEIKNTKSYEQFSLNKARKILQLEAFHTSHPFLFHFPKEQLSNYLTTLEEKGYEKITGEGIWFVCFNYSPGSVLENRRPNVVKYMIEDGSDGSITPFSYDPAQDFKTEM